MKAAEASLLCAAPLLCSTPAQAESADAYVTGCSRNPVRSYSGECRHSYGWREGSRFADCEPAPVVETPAPRIETSAALVEAPTAPAPTPIPQDVPFRVSMDTFFDFDQATLGGEGKAALDDVARRPAVTQYDTLTIVGHADRIGPAASNQKLSERRASAMLDYLLAQGIDGERISRSGVGASEPSRPPGPARQAPDRLPAARPQRGAHRRGQRAACLRCATR